MFDQPIVIAGFGRSGTTWLSDIMSKVLGGLVLFEPFHPAVFEEAHNVCYQTHESQDQHLIHHWEKCHSGKILNPWLIRNHLKDPVEDTTEGFIRYLWKHSMVIGFKTIRTNHFLSFFHKSFDARIIYIYRHPLAVLSSLQGRPRFWEEFGWDWHAHHFFSRALTPASFTTYKLDYLKKLKSQLRTKDETIIMMWCLSFILSMREVRKSSGWSVPYEQLYLDPYSEVKRMLNNIGVKGVGIHPSHIFTPSMTTLNTIHDRVSFSKLNRDELDHLFWKRHLDPKKSRHLLQLVSKILEADELAYQQALSANYLSPS